jgi:hypothetical protein
VAGAVDRRSTDHGDGLVIAGRIAWSAADEGSRVRAYAGLAAGLVAGSAFAITQLAGGRSEEANGKFSFSIVAVLIGLAVGFGLPYVVLVLPKAQSLVGLVTLALSASSSLATLNYLFAGKARDFTMLLSMSLLFGILVYLIFNGDKRPELRAVLGRRGLASPGDYPPRRTGY